MIAVGWLVLMPLLALLWWLGALGTPARRTLAAGLAAAMVGFSLPPEGLDVVYLKRLSLVLCAAAVALVLVARPQLESSRYRALLGLLTAAAVIVYTNFFSFHGARTFVHLHDTAHYYLGSKYFEELGYPHLYTGMLRAESELYQDHFTTLEARDLATGELTDIRVLLRASGPVEAAFSAARWEDFKRDVAMFREALGPQHRALYLDHGFNPTPLWATLGGALANCVPAGSRFGLLMLTLIDPLLLLAAFAMVGWAFGWEAAALAVIHFTLVFGASFAWTGGAFMRHLWLTSSISALCCLQRQRHRTAGALFALAAALRVFPIAFAVPLVVKNLRTKTHRSFTVALLLSGALLFGASLFQGRGLGAWPEFRTHLSTHLQNISPNVVGLTPALAWHDSPDTVSAEELRHEQNRRAELRRLGLAVFFVPTLVAACVLAPGLDDVAASLWGVPLLLTGLDLAAYYWVLLVLLLIANWNRPGRVAALFGLELASHLLALFDAPEHVTFIARSALLAWLLIGFHFEAFRARVSVRA